MSKANGVFPPIDKDGVELNTKHSATDLIRILLHHHFPLHGLPRVILTDRGSQFTSAIFQSVLSQLGCESHLSVTGHHQSNGKAERFIRIMQDYLVAVLDKNEDWANMVPIAEFVSNSTPSLPIGGNTPFALDIGYNPDSPLSLAYGFNETEEDIPYLLCYK